MGGGLTSKRDRQSTASSFISGGTFGSKEIEGPSTMSPNQLKK
jgi:hypothetical protein